MYSGRACVSCEGVDRGGESFGGGESVFGVFGQAAHDHVVELGRELWIVMRGRQRGAGNDLRAYGLDGIAAEGPLAGRHLVKNDTQREKIGTSVLQITENLLRREISRSAHQITAARGLRRKARNPKIPELHLLIEGHENIGGLHVAMNDIGAMGLAECGREIARPHGGASYGQRGAVEKGLQCFPLNIFHNKIRRALAVGAHIVKGHDVGMRQAADDLGFAEKLLLEIVGAKTTKQGF